MRKLNWRWILGLLLVFLLIRQGHFSLVTVILIIGAALVIWESLALARKNQQKMKCPIYLMNLNHIIQKAG